MARQCIGCGGLELNFRFDCFASKVDPVSRRICVDAHSTHSAKGKAAPCDANTANAPLLASSSPVVCAGGLAAADE